MTHAGAFPHGSPKGYELGCRSRGGCPYHRATTTLTCVEAAIAARGDGILAMLPADQPLPRRSTVLPTSRSFDEQPVAGESHGTVWRYRQGCRDATRCPHWRLGRVTCAEARRRYFADYHARRRTGRGTPIRHGTSAGYLSGCTSEEGCPRDARGCSCREARTEYRRRRARAQGIQPPASTVPADEAVRLVTELAQLPLTGREIARIAGVGRSTVARLMKAGVNSVIDRVTVREDTLNALRAAHTACFLSSAFR